MINTLSLGFDARHDDWRTSNELQTLVDECEHELERHIDSLLIHVDQEKWLKFERFEKGVPVRKNEHIGHWRGRHVFVAKTYTGLPCPRCGEVHE